MTMATAALRGILVVAAFLLGMLVIAKGFPEGSSAAQPEAPSSPATEGPQTTATFSPPPGVQPSLPASPASPGAQATPPGPVDLAGVSVQVLNGTNESGLAAGAAEQLESLGVKIVAVGNANKTYQITTIFFREDSEAIAQSVAQTQFPGARVQLQNNNLSPEIQLTVVLGEDYAAQQ